MGPILLLLILATKMSLAKAECENGFYLSQNKCLDEDECVNDDGDYSGLMDPDVTSSDDMEGSAVVFNIESSICGMNSTCVNTVGSYTCLCWPGFTNYQVSQGRCVEIQCDVYQPDGQSGPGLHSLLVLVEQNCLLMSYPGGVRPMVTGEDLLQELVNTTDKVQYSGSPGSVGFQTGFLGSVENIVKLIGPQLSENTTRIESKHTEAQFMVTRAKYPPRGPIHIATDHVQLDTNWETVTGNPLDHFYPGFAFIAMVSYKNLTFTRNKERLFSNVVTVAVSNPNTSDLAHPINITFTNLGHGDAHHRRTCVYWTEESEGSWSTQGCSTVSSNSSHTLCSYRHLSSFALIGQIHHKKSGGQLGMVILVCVVATIACAVVSLLSTLWCRYISKKRTQRHNSGHCNAQHQETAL
ncbi:hypothetical protein UPYG_G00272970 [Umbra pygmaea]|uniref:GAIN-B domain-containing protein n=1 Tax=Umbra pygmaea TaxID=75934 RepID=A0ABD0WGC1_UMBPY